LPISFADFKMTEQFKKSHCAKSSLETLLDSMDQLANSAAKKMTTAEIRRLRKEINASINRVADDGRKRRREL